MQYSLITNKNIMLNEDMDTDKFFYIYQLFVKEMREKQNAERANK